MSRYFLQDTPLAHMEKTMMRPPSYRPRGGGISVRRYQYTAADCDCRYCLKAEKEQKPCGEPTGCVCFEERLAAGCWTHGELAEYLIGEIAMKRLADRARRLLPPQPPTPFKDQAHRQRMTTIAAAMKPKVGVNHAGTVITAEPVDMKGKDYRPLRGKLNFLGDEAGLMDYLSERGMEYIPQFKYEPRAAAESDAALFFL